MNVSLGTPLSPTAFRLLLLGAGELGKEVVIEAQRLGVECIAVDRYADAPAMQVAHRSHVIPMLDGDALRRRTTADRSAHFRPAIHPPAGTRDRKKYRDEAHARRIVPDSSCFERYIRGDIG